MWFCNLTNSWSYYSTSTTDWGHHTWPSSLAPPPAETGILKETWWDGSKGTIKALLREGRGRNWSCVARAIQRQCFSLTQRKPTPWFLNTLIARGCLSLCFLGLMPVNPPRSRDPQQDNVHTTWCFHLSFLTWGRKHYSNQEHENWERNKRKKLL